MIKGLIFDMDGVLFDTENLHYHAWKDAFKTKNIYLSEMDYSKYCQAQGRVNAIRNIIDKPSPEDYKVISDLKARAYKKAIDHQEISIFDDAKTLLSFLDDRQDIKLALASSSVIAEYVLSKTYCIGQFSYIITGAMIDRNKPYPDIFELAAKKLDIEKKYLAVIEDSLAGLIGARLAGLNVFAINRKGSLDGKEIHRIDKYIEELSLNVDDIEIKNLHKSKTIEVMNLEQVINYL